MGAAELGLRVWLGPRVASWASFARSSAPDGLYLQSSSMGITVRPDFSGTTRSGTPIHTDALGLRVVDREERREGPGWLVLGDSFTLALQVPAEQSFPALLEEKLEQPVHNAGIDGASTWVAAERADALLPELELEGVLLVFYTGNDFEENGNWQEQAVVRDHARDGAPFPTGPDRWAPLRPLLRLSLLSHLALGTWEAQTAVSPGPDSTPGRQLQLFHRSGERQLRTWSRPTRAALQKLESAVESAGLPLVIAIAPPAYQVRPESGPPTFARYGLSWEERRLSAPARAVQQLAQEQGIPVCDLLPALRQAQTDKADPYLIFEGHWAPSGHQVVADALAACLEDHGLR